MATAGVASGNGAQYTWPGVPTELPGAVEFFRRTGWTFVETTDDVVLELPGFVTAPAVPGSAEAIAAMLGPDMSTIGCVGVAAEHQGAGIGTAMVARASEVLRDRGVGTCHIGWTTRAGFYGWLGYRHWRSYAMFRRDLSGEVGGMIGTP